MLSGALTALGIAATGVVSVGVGEVSNETSDQLSGASVAMSFETTAGSDDFEDGMGGWIGGFLDHAAAYGNTLRGGGTGGLQGARAVYELDPDMDYAVASFDMHAIDSWDNESFNVYVNDEVVARAHFQLDTDGMTGTWVTDNPDISVDIQATSSRQHAGHSAGWTDQSYAMTVTVANPGPQMSLGFGATLDQDVADESWAVDNVRVISTNNP